MDVSADYIKMCEKAEEIQHEYNEKYSPHGSGEWEKRGDFYYHHFHKIWLPRQDQLQEIVGDLSLEQLLLGVHEQYENSTHLVGYGLTMEQLWLAFVMSEKYEKKWTGTEWEK